MGEITRESDYAHLSDAELDQAWTDSRNAYRYKPSQRNVQVCEAIHAEVQRRAATSPTNKGMKP